jgi:cell cycle arrest protein BUB3
MLQGSPETELPQPPADGVTKVIFAHNSDRLLASSWDRTLRLYNARQNHLMLSVDTKAAILDCCFNEDDTRAFSGGIDTDLLMTDLKTGTQSVLGSHEAAIKAVVFNRNHGVAATGSWDSSVQLWDQRNHRPMIGSFTQEGKKVYTMDSIGNRLVVGTSGRHIYIYDIRQLSQPEQVRESSLMNQTRCIRCSPDGHSFAISSIEGRVAIEYFDTDPQIQARKYAFKCHRKTDKKTQTQTLYPVNCIAFHPRHGTFATGGCDRLINVWDGKNKKRICCYPPYPTSVASMAFNPAGDLLAVASSYTFEEGMCDHAPDAIFIRHVNDHEVAPKQPNKARLR